MDPYQDTGHQLFMNNFYTSLPLVKYLLKKGTFSAGTVCPNHKNFPEDLKVNMKMNVNVY